MSARGRWLVVLLLATSPARAADAPAPSPAIPAIVAAFATYPVVAIAESHGLVQAGAFYVALVRDSTFQRACNTIVVEFASAQSQPLLDRLVLDLAPVPADSVRWIWRNTTKVASWEFPIYDRLLAAIVEANRALPRARRMRVVAGDTRVDWSRMHMPNDWQALGDNNVTMANVIEQQIASGRHTLVVFGSNHLTRGGNRNGGPNVATRIEARAPAAMYIVWLYTGRPGGDDVDARIADEHWPLPAFMPLRGTWLGQLAAGSRRLEQVADAMLVVAPAAALASEQAAPESFEPAYRAELDRRSWIEWGDSTRARRFLGLPARP